MDADVFEDEWLSRFAYLSMAVSPAEIQQSWTPWQGAVHLDERRSW